MLSVKQGTGFFHESNFSDPRVSKLEIHFCGESGIAFLVGPRNVHFSLSSKGPRSFVQDCNDGTFSILDLWSRQYLSARPAGGQMETRTKVNDWERFKINEPRVQIEVSDLTINVLHKRVVRADDIVHLTTQCEKSADWVISALLPLLSLEESRILGEKISSNSELVENLNTIFPRDLWLSKALPHLYSQVNSTTGGAAIERSRIIDESFDRLRTAGKNGVTEGAGFALNAMARSTVKPTRRSCIVATARNEGIYLVEWVAYHRALGFDEIIIYSNNNTDGSDQLLSALAETGQIIWYDNRLDPKNSDAQNKAYSHALSVLPDILDFEWAAFIDIDEFIYIDQDVFSDLSDFLNWHSTRDTDAIALNWVYFGSVEEIWWRDEPFSQRLNGRSRSVNGHIKSIFRPQKAISSQPHFPREGERHSLLFRGGDGALHSYSKSPFKPHIAKAFSDHPNDSHAFIAHFFFRTCEEFLWKFSRNRGDHKLSGSDITLALDKRFLTSFLAQKRGQQDEFDLTLHNTAFHDVHDRILGINSVKEAALLVKDKFRERSARVIEMYRPFLLDEMGEEGKQMLDLLDS